MSQQNPFGPRKGLQSAYPRTTVHARHLELGKKLLQLLGPTEESWRGPADESCRRSPTSLLPSAEGRVEHLLVTVPAFVDPLGEAVIDPWLQDHLFGIIGHFGPSVRHTVVCQFEQEEEIQWWFEQLGIPDEQFQLVFSKYQYSVWAQDAYLALEVENRKSALCEGVRFLRNDDMVVADDVAAQTDVSLLHSILEFQGGNLLGGSEGHLLGRDYVEWNTGRRRLETPDLVVREFEDLLGGPVFVVGLDEMIPDEDRRGDLTGHWQPIFHLDMYVTRTGLLRGNRELLLVGSPREARRHLGQSEQPEDQDEYFDQAAEQLEQLGFAVDRIPLLRLRESPDGWKELDYVLTWNNVVVENYIDSGGKQVRRVLLPTYSDPENRLGVDQSKREILDAAATKIWEDLHFEVLLVGRMEDLAYAAGSVHCITKVLKRSRSAGLQPEAL